MPAAGTFTVVTDVEVADNPVSGRLTVRFQNGADYASFGAGDLETMGRFNRAGEQAVAVQANYALELPTDIAAGGDPALSAVGYDLTWFSGDPRRPDAKVTALFTGHPAGSTVYLSSLVNSEPGVPVAVSQGYAAQAEAARDAAVAAAASVQREQASGVAGLDATGKLYATRIPDAVKPDNGGKPVGKGELVVNVRDHGAAGDGVADDTSEIQAALTAAAAAGSSLVLIPRGTYKVTAQLNVPSGVTILGDGATLDFNAMPDATALNQKFGLLAAGSLGSGVTVGTAIAQWSRTVTGLASTSGFTAGDLVLVSNDERPVPGMSRTDRDKGELNIVQSVDSASQITLRTGALFAYGTTSLTVAKVTPATDITISGVTLRMGGVGSAHTGVCVQWGRNITVADCTIIGGEDNGVALRGCYNAEVRNNRIEASTSNGTLGNTGYGVAVLDGSRFVRVHHNHIEDCRHCVAGGGAWPPAFVDIEDNAGQRASDVVFDCHESTLYWNFRRNRAIAGTSGGFIIRGQYVTLDNNEVYDCVGEGVNVAVYDGVTEQRGIKVRGTLVRRCSAGIRVDGLNNGGSIIDHVKYDCEVSGSDIDALTTTNGVAVLVRHFVGAVVKGNRVKNALGPAIDCRGLTGTQASGLQITDNIAQTPTLEGIKIDRVDDVHGNLGHVTNGNQQGVMLTNCNRVNITGLLVRAARLASVQIDTCTVVAVGDSVLTGNTLSTSDAVRVLASTTVSVVGCLLAGARHGVMGTTSNYLTITGNDTHLSASAPKVNLDASAVNVVNANNL